VSSVMLRWFAESDSLASRASARLGALQARLLTAATAGMKLLSTQQIAQRTADALLSVLLVGSVFVVPVACVLAVICAVFPGMTSLRHFGAELFALAIVWFTVAVFGAHLRPRELEEHA
jgi:hypothetical protein